MPSHREMTRRRTLRRQGVAVVLVALAGAGIALPISGALSPGKEIRADSPEIPAGALAALTPPPAPLDVSRYVTTLTALAPPVPASSEPVAAVMVDEPQDEPEEVVVAPPPAAPAGKLDQWVYLGWIVGPRTKHALVRVETRQLMLPEGSEHDGVRVLSVEQDHIQIGDGTQEKRVDLLKPVALWARAPIPARPAAASAVAPQRDAAMKRDEMAKRMQSNGRIVSAGDDRKSLGGMDFNSKFSEEYAKRLSDPGLSDDDRLQMLDELGMNPSLSPAQRARMLFNSGLPFTVDPMVLNAMENSGIPADTDPEKAMMQLQSIEGGGR